MTTFPQILALGKMQYQWYNNYYVIVRQRPRHYKHQLYLFLSLS